MPSVATRANHSEQGNAAMAKSPEPYQSSEPQHFGALNRLASRAAAFLALLLLIVGIAFGPAFAQQPAPSAPPDPGSVRARLDSIRTELTGIEVVVDAPSSSDADLQRQRVRLQPSLDHLRVLIEEQTPRVDQAKAKLDQLGPKPDANAPPESPDIARERDARIKAYGDADETLRLAKAALLQAQQLQTAIGDKRRDIFAKALFAAGPSILNPEVWGNAVATAPEDLRASGYIFGGWLEGVNDALSGTRGLVILLSLLVALLLYLVRARYLPRFKARYTNMTESGGLHCLYVALAHIVAGAAPPALASWLIYKAFATTGLLPPRIQPVIWAFVVGLAFFAFVQALADAIFASGNRQRRLISVMDTTARSVVWIASSLALVMAVGKVSEAWLQAIAAGLAISIIVKAGFAMLFALTLIAGLYQIRDDEEIEQEACLGPYVPVDGARLGPLRIIGWIIGIAIIAAALGGYVVFASFLAEQTLWIGVIACLYLLVHQFIDLGIPRLLSGKGRLAMTLKAGVGLRSATLDKISVISVGLLKLLLIIVAVLLVLAPWGLESTDFFVSVRAAFFGVQVGGVTISLSTIVIGVFVFALGVAATKAIQRWLENQFLPTTSMDLGLRNSITTAAGYVGFTSAVAIAVSAVGLSLERLTLVASALSVGIGFGLQSVVSNFVSGLILLWERPIRVGDQVVVGDVEGIVKRINVRSTEIATFDRATVIVPNSNLISGVVRNRVRNDRTGRVLISLSVPRTLDAGEVRAMLSEVSGNHGDVMQKPPATVLFKKLGTATMDFDLICVVADVEIVGRVTSDLNFAIQKRLAEMEPAAATPELLVKGLDGVEQSLGEIAAAVSSREPPRRVAPKTAPAARRPLPLPDAEETGDEAAETAAKPAPATSAEPAKDDKE
ncbi:Small-conductance mechanosensitive channel [Bosea sp. TND4EK4]|nr:Small-conductance mechanosensitive channel [Bosea sp. TND4EK4]